ncbi:hypothetical protein ACFX2I_032422 [Malus domestica]
MVGSPTTTTSSMSRNAGGSPRTTSSTSTGNKAGQISSLSSQQAKNSPSVPSQKSSPIGGRNVPSIVGNTHITSSSASTKPQLQQQHLQLLSPSHLLLLAPRQEHHEHHAHKAAPLLQHAKLSLHPQQRANGNIFTGRQLCKLNLQPKNPKHLRISISSYQTNSKSPKINFQNHI